MAAVADDEMGYGVAFDDLQGDEFFPIVGPSRTSKITFSVCSVGDLRCAE